MSKLPRRDIQTLRGHGTRHSTGKKQDGIGDLIGFRCAPQHEVLQNSFASLRLRDPAGGRLHLGHQIHDRRTDIARGDHIHANTIHAVLTSEAARQAEQRMLGYLVGTIIFRLLAQDHRADHHDRSLAGGPHMGNDCLREPQRRKEIDLETLLNLFDIIFLKASKRRHHESVVDQNIHPAKLQVGFLHQSLAISGSSKIGRDRQGANSQSTHLVGHFGQSFLGARGQNHVGPFARELEGRCSAQAGTDPRDNRHLPFQKTHLIFLRTRRYPVPLGLQSEEGQLAGRGVWGGACSDSPVAGLEATRPGGYTEGMPTEAEIHEQIFGEGAPFEMQTEPVLGTPMPVFRNRMPSLRALLDASAAHGDHPYLVFDTRRISYARHHELVAAIAHSLQEDFGVRKGDRVAILAANRPEWILTFWATVGLGAIAVGLNGWWTSDEILYGLKDADPKVLIADAKRLERLAGHDHGIPVVEMETQFAALEARAGDLAFPDADIEEDDPAFILYTSGTTGRPKGAVTSHRSVLGFVAINQASGFRNFLLQPPAADALPNCMYVTNPLFHVSGLQAAAIMGLSAGLKTVWNSGRFEPERTMSQIQTEKCTSWGAMNTVLHRLMTHPAFPDYDLSSLKQVGGGGAPTAPEMQRKIREAFPALREGNLGHGYGSTESGALATVIGGAEWEEHPTSVGRPQPTVTIEIRDDDGRALPEGEEGEVFVRSPLNMLGYWRRPEETAETLLPGHWLRTGDWGHLKNGRLYLASRRRDLILRASENVYPVEIENRLVEHPAVVEAAVVGVPHEELGQEVKAFVVLESDQSIPAAELTEFVGEKLAYFKVPSQWDIGTKLLPRNPTGKILKNVLTGEAANRFVEE